MNISALWDTLVDAICRPPRDKYQTGELIGGRRGYCKLSGKTIVRDDLVLVNKQGQKLVCSHYRPSGATAQHALPIVVYCHCNSGSRRDAEEAFYVLLPHNITVFCLDFAGSGLSDGGWVTLGSREVEDLEVVVGHLRDSFPNSTIGLWGRSMGAVTALLYSAKDPSIAGVVMDSPFARLTELMVELVDEQKLPIPKTFMKVALSMMRRSVRKRAGFDIDTVAPLETVPHCFIPALFGHATEDTFVAKTHSQRLHDAYAGSDKSLVTFKGDHNSVRPQSFYSSVLTFLHVALHCTSDLATLPVGSKKPEPSHQAACKRLSAEATDDSCSQVASDSETPTKLEHVSPRQRELAPPWNREEARCHTERQLEVLRGMANNASDTYHPASAAASSGQERSHTPSDSLGSHWLDYEPALDPPSCGERAPWLAVEPTAGTAPPEAAQAVGRSAGTHDEPRLDQSKQIREEARQPEPPETPDGDPAHTRERSSMSAEDRFWHLQLDDSALSSEDEEALLVMSSAIQKQYLARALEESMRDVSLQPQAHSATATAHAGRETRLDELIPDNMRNISQEDAEELMLVEAIKASLLDAEQAETAAQARGSPERPLHQRGDSRRQSQDEESGGRRRKSKGFWRRKETPPSPSSVSQPPSRQRA